MFKYVIAITIGTAYLLWAVPSYSFCVETGDGSVLPGSMPSNACKSLLNTLSQQSSGTYMFRVQESAGFYGKVCNEENQIIEQNFEERKTTQISGHRREL